MMSKVVLWPLHEHTPHTPAHIRASKESCNLLIVLLKVKSRAFHIPGKRSATESQLCRSLGKLQGRVRHVPGAPMTEGLRADAACRLARGKGMLSSGLLGKEDHHRRVRVEHR